MRSLPGAISAVIVGFIAAYVLGIHVNRLQLLILTIVAIGLVGTWLRLRAEALR